MKRLIALSGALAMSLLGFVSAAMTSESVNAGIYCFQLGGCSGQAGCYGDGSITGPCKIHCSAGGDVNCDS